MAGAGALEDALPADLVFALDDEPGIERHGQRRFRYVDQRTHREVTGADALARIRSLAVPPAWTDVWISADPNGHLQATGRDARGRKQYRYHPHYRAHRDAAKFEHLVPFAQVLPDLRARVSKDLARRGLPFEKVVALVVRLLEESFVRVGNEEYARANGSYGLTTLRNRHVRTDGSKLRIRFRAKSAKTEEIVLDDPRLVRLVRRCQELPGQVLFQYETEQDRICPIRSSEVNDYLREVTGAEITAKTFRTWGATLMAAVGLAALPPPTSTREGKQVVKGMLELVSGELNNTPAVCRRSYIHPAIIDGYLEGELREQWTSSSARGSARLTKDERRLGHLLASIEGAGGSKGQRDR